MGNGETDDDHLRLTAMGLEVLVRCGGSGRDVVSEAVLEAWADCGVRRTAADDRRPGAVIDVTLDDDRDTVESARAAGRLASTSLAELMDALSPMVTMQAIEALAGRAVMLHACGLASPSTGATAALVAGSGTGKTTLARTLGRTFGYVTDETVTILDDLTVLPYPKPLSVLATEGSPLKEQQCASGLGLKAAPDRVRLAGVALLVRDPDGPELEVTTVDTVPALADLGPQVSFLPRLERPLSRLASVLHRTSGLRRVRYREARDLGLRGRPPGGRREPAVRASRKPVDDEYVEDGQCALLVDQEIVVLSPLATAVWHLLGDGMEATDQLVPSLVAAFGSPEGSSAEELTRTCLRQLADQGLLTLHTRD